MLMDTGAIRSLYLLQHLLQTKYIIITKGSSLPKVIGADGGDLGSMGLVELMLILEIKKVKQEFIVCRELWRNIILGVDFAKLYCAGIQWMANRT